MDTIEQLLKEYKQILYRRIQIACALAIIQATPPGVSPERFAAAIQTRITLSWLRKTTEDEVRLFQSNVEHHVLKQHQQALTSRLLSLVPTNTINFDQDLADNPGDLLWENNQKMEKETETVLNSEILNIFQQENDKHVRVNAEFIRGVVQLKHLTELHVTIPVSKYFDSISKGPALNITQTDTKACLENLHCSDSKIAQRISGVSSSDEINTCEQASSLSKVQCVDSSVLQYIISSCNANQLVVKSVEAIFNHLQEYLCENRETFSPALLQHICTHWKGSVNEYANVILQGLAGSDVNGHLFEQMFFRFLQDVVCNIILVTGKETSFLVKENQCAILTNLTWIIDLQASILNFLVDKFHHLNLEFHTLSKDKRGLINSENELRESSLKDAIEKSYFLLILARNLITSEKRIKSQSPKMDRPRSNNQNTKNSQRQNTSVAEIWRRRYGFAVVPPKKIQDQEVISGAGSETKKDQSWKQRLEQMLTNNKEKSTLVTFLIWDCIN